MASATSRSTSFRLSADACRQLSELARREKITQTALLERLIADAAKGSEAYYGRAAAIHSWMAASLAIILLDKLGPGDTSEIVEMVQETSNGLFGPLPPPPEGALDLDHPDPRVQGLLKAYGVLK